jgi:hypothetical protein
VLDGAIKLPKMKPVKANIHREIIGSVKSITVSLSKTGKFYPIAPSAPSKSNEPKRVNLGGGERRTTTKWWL